MKFFISWSGELSKDVAELLKEWIPTVLQSAEPWISTVDIDKGSIWFGDISKELRETSIGILCLTKENLNAPWLLFEAGALSKGLEKSRVCPLLINLKPEELRPPLSQFNAALPSIDDLLKLIKTMNNFSDGRKASDNVLGKSFERAWGEFSSRFHAIIGKHKSATKPTHRSQEDKINEILEMTRTIHNSVQDEKYNIKLGRTAFNGFTRDWPKYRPKQQTMQNAIIVPYSPDSGYGIAEDANGHLVYFDNDDIVSECKLSTTATSPVIPPAGENR